MSSTTASSGMTDTEHSAQLRKAVIAATVGTDLAARTSGDVSSG